MPMTNKLTALRNRLIAAQRELITLTAATDAFPSDNALRKIANLEVAIAALETMQDDLKK